MDINYVFKVFILFNKPFASQQVETFSLLSSDLHALSLADHRVLERLLSDTFIIFQQCVEIEKNV